MRNLLSAIALAALATATVHADPGGGKGNGGGKDHGGGNGESADRGGFEQSKGQDGREEQGKRGGYGNREHEERAADRGWNKHGNQDRADDGREIAGTSLGHGRFESRGENDQGDHDHARFGRDDRANTPFVGWREFDRRGLISGCPPGLAKKNNGCMPPGLAKQNQFDRYDANWWGLRGLNNLSGYRYLDGNLVRLTSGGAVMDYYPLLGGALAPGNQWPSAWQPTPLSPYYSDYYGLGNDYRYFDGAIYRVDPSTSAIQTVAALLTGDNFTVGQRMPSGYSAYNVPYQYRDQYADGPDANYRYSDGYVYKTDPKTQLILAAIQLLR